MVLCETDDTAVYHLKRIFISKPVKEQTPATYEEKISSSRPKYGKKGSVLVHCTG